MFWRLQIPKLNDTQLNDIAPAWVQEPNGRGMEDIFAPSGAVSLKRVFRNMENHIQLLFYFVIVCCYRDPSVSPRCFCL